MKAEICFRSELSEEKYSIKVSDNTKPFPSSFCGKKILKIKESKKEVKEKEKWKKNSLDYFRMSTHFYI